MAGRVLESETEFFCSFVPQSRGILVLCSPAGRRAALRSGLKLNSPLAAKSPKDSRREAA